MWRTRWLAYADEGEVPHPPVLIVFNHIGARDPNRTIPRLQELTRPLWAGQATTGGYHSYDRKIPIIATGLRNLREHGPAGPVFLRFGRTQMQPLRDAIGNPSGCGPRSRAGGDEGPTGGVPEAAAARDGAEEGRA